MAAAGADPAIPQRSSLCTGEGLRDPEGERDPTNVEATRRNVLPALQRLDAHLGERPYVAGDSFTVGDIAPACAAYRWSLFALEAPAMPHLADWQARFSEREGFRRHIAPREFHLR